MYRYVGLVLALLLVACSPKEVRQRSGGGGPDSIPANKLEEINRSRAEIMTAVREAMPSLPKALAVTGFTSATLSNRKVEKMRKSLEDPEGKNCRGDWQENFDLSEALYVKSAPGGKCPLLLLRSWRRVEQPVRWQFAERLSVDSADFRSLSVVHAYRAVGDLAMELTPGGSRISGRIEYSDVVLQGIEEPVSVLVTTQQTYVGLDAAGEIKIQMKIGYDTSEAAVRWDSLPMDPRYFYNGQEIDSKRFNLLFSFVGVTEIMDRSLAIR